MKLKEFIFSLIETTKANIIELAQTELSNSNKKLVLDNKIINHIEMAIDKLSLNFILKNLIKKMILPNISVITQTIFDLIKMRVDGVTN